MKIAVINGTQVRGCTYHIKECFLDELRAGNTVTEFYLPKDLPEFCCGCKTCFFKSEALCPHAGYVQPIWNAMLEVDLLVFTTPVYALRATGQIKVLLDHLCVHWMVHRPDARMFEKRAAILTNAVGMFNGGAQKDIAVSLSWMGVSSIRKLGVGLMEGVEWGELSAKRKEGILKKTRRLARRFQNARKARKGIIVSAKFAMAGALHRLTAKQQDPLSADNAYWKEQGWI